MFPERFGLEHCQELCPKRSILALLKIRKYFQKLAFNGAF